MTMLRQERAGCMDLEREQFGQGKEGGMYWIN